MKISVVIPAYNAERCIARAIRSVLAQTRPAKEIVVVDDGSTDGTAEAVRAFGDAVRLIQQPNAGASVARNTGIEAAIGDWIAFIDADDEWLPQKLQLQAVFHQQYSNLKWSYTRLERAHPQWKTHRLSHPDSVAESRVFEDYLDAYCKGFYISTITVMVHRSVFDIIGMFEPGMKRAQDSDMWFRTAYRFPQVGYIPQSLAVYHLDTPNSSTKINDRVDFMVDHIERHRKLSQTFNRDKAFAPCITMMLQVWIRQLLKQKRRHDALVLLKRYASFLSGRFRREIAFRLSVPWLGPRIADAVEELKIRRRNQWSS